MPTAVMRERKHREVLPQRLEVPLDDEDARFTRSFHPDDADSDDARHFFDTFGFIVFHDAASAEQSRETADDMWTWIEENSVGAGDNDDSFIRGDPSTWDKGPLHRFGMPKGIDGMFRSQLLRVRQDPVIFKCFASILGSQDIVVNHDRWLLHRPTMNVDGMGTNRIEWETERNVHLDLNPWSYHGAKISAKGKAKQQKKDYREMQRELSRLRYHTFHSRSFITENNLVDQSMGLSVQGILNVGGDIADISHGGTIVIPGFHKVFDEWVEHDLMRRTSVKNNESGQFRFKDTDRLNTFAQHVTLREGSLLIWDQRLAHGSTPNRSSTARCAVPIRFFPAGILRRQRERGADRAEAVRRGIHECRFEEELTALGRRVFGLDLFK